MTYKKDGVSMGAALSPPEFNMKATDSTKVHTFVDLAKGHVQ